MVKKISLDQKKLEDVVNLMVHDIMNPDSVEDDSIPQKIYVHGGNGYLNSVTDLLRTKLGNEFDVSSVESDFFSRDNVYSLSLNHYLDRLN